MSERAAFALRFADLEVGYGRQRVAGPVSGSWSSGAVWVLTGPNGAGKTTLLRTLLGLQPALAGRIDRPVGCRCSYVPQLGRMDAAFPVTVGEVVGTGLDTGLGGLPRRQRRQRAAQALDAVGLVGLVPRPFFALSGGQRQRVLLARALCADAGLVALDEPTAGVDAGSATQVWQAIGDLARGGRLVVVVTHDVFRAPQHADHVLVLDGGRLVEQEPVCQEPGR